MINHILKITFRNLFKDLESTLLNVLGLAIGMAVSIYVFAFVVYELNYDKHISDSNRKFRIISKLQGGNYRARTFYCFRDGLLNDVPEVEDATAFVKFNTAYVSLKNIPREINDILVADTSFINMFSVKVMEGDPSDLGTPNTMFITEKEAAKLFPGEDPIGKEIYFKSVEGITGWDSIGYYTIIGIVRPLQPNTHFQFNYLLSAKGHFDNFFSRLNGGKVFGSWVYVKLANANDKNGVEGKLQQTASKYLKNAFGPPVEAFIHKLQPLRSIHFTTGMSFELDENRERSSVYILGLIAFLILIVACLNFIILFTTKSSLRFAEVGLKKTLGANKKHLFIQYMTEVAIICMFAMLTAIILIENIAPLFNRFLRSDIHFNYFNVQTIILMGCTFIFTFLLAGSYSALSFSSQQPLEIFKSRNFSGNWGKISLKSMLVILQFIISIALITCMITIRKQLNYVNNKNLGYDKKNILVLNLPDNQPPREIIKNKLLNISGIEYVGSTNDHFAYGFHNSNNFSHGNLEFPFEFAIADLDYIKALNIKIVKEFHGPLDESSRGFIINETFYKHLRSELSEEELTTSFNNMIGVMKDFQYGSLHSGISDFALNIWPDRFNRFLIVNYKTPDIKELLDNIKKVWKETYPEYPFSFDFYEDLISGQYQQEKTLGSLIFYFALLAIFISCLGLIGLSRHVTRQRTKEIGIRKATGATTWEIMLMLSKDLTKWVVLAFMIAGPIAFFAMNKWLQNFAYRTSLSWWVFVLAGLIAYLIALLTVGWQSWHVASRNPVEALRYE